MKDWCTSKPPGLKVGDTKLRSAKAAASLVRDGDRLVIGGCGAAPLEFLRELSLRTDLVRVDISHATAWGDLPHLRSHGRPSHLNFESYFLPALARGLQKKGIVDYIPVTFSQMGGMYANKTLGADVVAVTCSMPDEEGFCSLGPFVNYLPAAIDRARLVIGECSSAWPETLGAAKLHISEFECLIAVDRPPLPAPDVAGQIEAEPIAQHVKTLVPNGATIQIGRGAIPNAIASALNQHRDLGIHSEMISDWIIDLCQSGAVNGSRKATYPGRIVTSFADGSDKLHAFLHRNPSVLMRAIYDVNDPAAIAAEPHFIAINSAVEVDLTGQVNAETARGHQISGSGGLLDFAIGAGSSSHGCFIVALPSTALNGSVSRIVHQFAAGAVTTVPRTLTQFVVTEYGIADLRGCSLRERMRRLAAIAAPHFRSDLLSKCQLEDHSLVS